MSAGQGTSPDLGHDSGFRMTSGETGVAAPRIIATTSSVDAVTGRPSFLGREPACQFGIVSGHRRSAEALSGEHRQRVHRVASVPFGRKRVFRDGLQALRQQPCLFQQFAVSRLDQRFTGSTLPPGNA